MYDTELTSLSPSVCVCVLLRCVFHQGESDLLGSSLFPQETSCVVIEVVCGFTALISWKISLLHLQTPIIEAST